MHTSFKLILLSFLFILTFSVDAQRRSTKPKPKSKTQLEREKRENLNRIKEANRILEQTKVKKEASIGQLNAIQEKITVQKGVITNISSELTNIDTDMRQTESTVGELKTDLQKLKAEYAAMIYGAAKTANSYNKMMFLFASESFNTLVMRLRYLRQYSEARKIQVRQISAVSQNLEQKITVLSSKKQEKESLLSVQLKENKNLLNLKNEQSNVITQLSQQEQKLKEELERRIQADRKLNNLIADLVREEIARSARVAKTNAASSGTTATTRSSVNKVTLTPSGELLSSNFGGNRGRFPWPVERGFISQRFGTHPDPVLKNITRQNNGVDIQTENGVPAKSIFDGKVTAVASIPGLNNIVMIQHGEYFTVYAKLKSVSVNEGDQVNARDTIGSIYTDSEGTTVLHFEVWRNGDKLNPESWLIRK